MTNKKEKVKLNIDGLNLNKKVLLMSVVTTSAKGQVVIPKKERRKIGIKPGSKVEVRTVNDHIEIHPLPEDPIEYLCGIFKDYPRSLTQTLLKERKKGA